MKTRRQRQTQERGSQQKSQSKTKKEILEQKVNKKQKHLNQSSENDLKKVKKIEQVISEAKSKGKANKKNKKAPAKRVQQSKSLKTKSNSKKKSSLKQDKTKKTTNKKQILQVVKSKASPSKKPKTKKQIQEAKIKSPANRRKVPTPKKINEKKQETAKPLQQNNKQVNKQKNDKQEAVEKVEKENAKAEQIKKVQFKGKIPVDDHFPLKKSPFHVLEHGGQVYSATLNQSSVENNNNKFYIIQVLQGQDKSPINCYLFTRWGRVGVQGQISCMGPYSLNVAVSLFNTKKREKALKGNYREIELNYGVEEAIKKIEPKGNEPPSKLAVPVQQLIELIFDLGMMNKHMVEIGYNVDKMPLGKLSEANIRRGYDILKQLLNQIQHEKRNSEIARLTDDFYSIIPHDFGFTKMHMHILATEQVVKKKLQMLQALGQIKVATTILSADKGTDNKIDSNYEKLNRDIKYIPKDTEEYNVINNYLQTTHAQTHKIYQLELVDLFGLQSDIQNSRFTKEVGNKMLLWHGSRLTNFVGILSQGLRIAPPQAPVTGYMFGKGVYFADMSSKSANYCFTSQENNTGILLLCEVALGDMNMKYYADYYAGNLPPGKLSTKGCGKTAPEAKNEVVLDGVTVPMGPAAHNSEINSSLLYNEFIVYDIAQIKIKYLLRTKFNYTRR